MTERNVVRVLAVLGLLSHGCSSSSTNEGTGPSKADPGPTPTAPARGDDPPSPTPHVAACPDGDAFRLVSGKIVVDVTLDGGPKQSWVLDTGAFTSVADTTIASQVENREVKVSVGGIEKAIRFDVFDVRSSLRMDVAGVLGQDVFGEVLTIDYPRKRFFVDHALDADREADLAACTHVMGKPSTVDAIYDYFLHVRGSAEGMEGWFLVDSGASLGATRKSVFAALDAAHPRPALHGFYTPAAVGTFWAQLSTIGSMKVGEHTVKHIVTRTIDDKLLPPPKGVPAEQFIGVLPSLYLRHFMVTADFVKTKLRIDPAKSDPMREPTMLHTIGIGIQERLEAPVIVAEVLKGSAAEEAGIVPGDEITSLGGAPVASLDPSTRAFRLVAPASGTKIAVGLVHEGTARLVDLETRDLLTAPE